MRLISLLLFVLLLAIQYPLWLGKGGWLRVWDLNRQVQEQTTHNQALKLATPGWKGKSATSRTAPVRSRNVPATSWAW